MFSTLVLRVGIRGGWYERGNDCVVQHQPFEFPRVDVTEIVYPRVVGATGLGGAAREQRWKGAR